MAVVTDPRRLELPLPGGHDGATVRLHPLLCAEMKAPPGYWERPPGPAAEVRELLLKRRSGWITLPIPAFLVEHPTAGAILIDTGLHGSVAHDPSASLGKLGGRLLAPRMTADQAVPVQIAARGVMPEDVAIVVMTHLHFDHASGISQFPEPTFVVARQEWDSASESGLTHGYFPRQFDHAFQWRTIDFERDQTVDSFATFARTVDLLGDGSIRLAFTPGHSAGHCSVLLRLAGREVLLTGDAAYAQKNIDNRSVPLVCPDEHLYLRSLDEIRRFTEQTPGALVICGHDPWAWPQLKSVYE